MGIQDGTATLEKTMVVPYKTKHATMAWLSHCTLGHLSQSKETWLPRWSSGKESACLLANAGDVRDTGLIPGSGRSCAEGNGNSLLYSCLENPMDREAWQYTVHSVAKNRNDWEHTHIHTYNENICLCQNLKTIVHSNFICDSQKLETTQKSFSWWTESNHWY